MVSFNKQEVKHQKLTYKSRFIFYLIFLLISALGMFVKPTVTYATDEYAMYFIIENFNWEEFSGGSSLLEESGPLYGLGFNAKFGGEIPNPIAFKFKGELFGGNVDYDGQTQEGIPVSSGSDYTGFKAEIDIGWQIFIGESSSSVEPFFGLGGRWWTRDINSSGIAIGYEETWTSYYTRLGFRFENISPNQLKLFIELALISPFKNENEIDFSSFGLGQVTTEPGNSNSFRGEIGIKSGKFVLSAFYERLRFSESDPVDAGAFLIIQPESEANIYGVNIGITF